jgi:hypothetical protein
MSAAVDLFAADAQAPAFRKMTPKVVEGLRYAITSLEMDAAYAPAVTVRDSETGKPVEVGIKLPIDDEALRAAAEWLRYQVGKREA